jgi:mRNA interferase MazF
VSAPASGGAAAEPAQIDPARRDSFNLARAGEPTHRLIKASAIEGQDSGLLHDSLVSCNNLVTLKLTRIHKVIGSLPVTTMQEIDDWPKAARGLR